MILEIHPQATTRSTIDCNLFIAEPASLEDHQAYTHLLEALFQKHADDIRFFISTTICRLEAQTHLFDAVYKYAAILELIRKQPAVTLLNLRPIVLVALVRYLRAHKVPFRFSRDLSYWSYRLRLTRAFFLAKLAALTVYTLFFCWLTRRELGPWRGREEDLFFSYYDFRSLASDGTYRDPYFAPLQAHMQASKRSYEVLAILVGPKTFASARERVRELRKMQQCLNIAPIENVLTLRDVGNVILRSLRHWFRLVPGKVEFRGHDIASLLELSFFEDFGLRNNWYFSYVMERVAERLVRQPRLKRIYYPYENHPWERLINRAKTAAKVNVKTIGYQHTSFSLKLLNHFPTRFDTVSNVLPDRLVTSGPILRDFLAEYGNFPAGTLVSGCALRHAYLYSQRQPSGSDRRTGRIAFSFSSDGSTYPAIMRSLIEFFAGSEYTVLLKPHPLLKDLKLFSENLPKNIVDGTAIPWKEIFTSVDLIFYHDNSLGIEAFAYQVPSCDYQIAGEAYNPHRLFAYPGDYLCIRNRQDLERVLATLAKRMASQDYVVQENAHMASYVRDYFIEPTPEAMSAFLQV